MFYTQILFDGVLNHFPERWWVQKLFLHMFKMGYEIFSNCAKLSSALVPRVKSDRSLTRTNRSSHSLSFYISFHWWIELPNLLSFEKDNEITTTILGRYTLLAVSKKIASELETLFSGTHYVSGMRTTCFNIIALKFMSSILQMSCVHFITMVFSELLALPLSFCLLSHDNLLGREGGGDAEVFSLSPNRGSNRLEGITKLLPNGPICQTQTTNREYSEFLANYHISTEEYG